MHLKENEGHRRETEGGYRYSRLEGGVGVGVDEGLGGFEAASLGPKGAISCSTTLGQSDRRLCGCKCVSYVHVNYRERDRGLSKSVEEKAAQRQLRCFPSQNKSMRLPSVDP